MNVTRVIISIATLLLWGMLAVTDLIWLEVVTQAVRDQTGQFGELYGPVSFARPILFWLSAVGTILSAILTVVPHRARSNLV